MSILALNFDACWHRFWFHFGTPLASRFVGDCFWDDLLDRFWSKMDPILAPLWHQILCFGVLVFLMSFFDNCLIDFGIDVRRLLAPFWSIVGPLLAPFGSFWLPLASLWQALHSLGVRFASCLSFEVFGFAFSDFLCYGEGFMFHISVQILRKINCVSCIRCSEHVARPVVAQAT